MLNIMLIKVYTNSIKQRKYFVTPYMIFPEAAAQKIDLNISAILISHEKHARNEEKTIATSVLLPQ